VAKRLAGTKLAKENEPEEFRSLLGAGFSG